MAKFSGIAGSVVMSGTSGNWGAGVVVNNLREWTADINTSLVDSTTKGDGGFSSDVYGVKTCSGTITMAADDTTAIVIAGSTDPTVTLNLTGTSRKITGSAKIDTTGFTGQSMAPPGELATVTFNFRYQGTFTVA